jgi:hypothetical protein
VSEVGTHAIANQFQRPGGWAMNRKVSSGLSSLLLFWLLSAHESIEAFIQIQNQPSTSVIPVQSTIDSSRSSQLLQSLERITCLQLEITNSYLRVKESEKLPLLYASLTGPYQVESAVHSDRRCSSTAKELLLSALRSSNVYKVRENKQAAFGRVADGDSIELDFTDFGEIIFKEVPREAFDIGMIFLHELAHRHLLLTDPKKDEIKKDSFVKGETVSFINRIERELKLPERRHYAPVKIRYNGQSPHWGVYYGNGTDRIELDPRFGFK